MSGSSGSRKPGKPAPVQPEAIYIVKLTGTARSSGATGPLYEEYVVSDVHARVEKKFEMICRQENEERAANGWTLFEGNWIPPGWVRPDPD